MIKDQRSRNARNDNSETSWPLMWAVEKPMALT